MHPLLRRTWQSMLPFLAIGLAISIMFALIIIFSHLLIWGLVIGVFLWFLASVRAWFSKGTNKPAPRGRIIEYRDHQ